MNAGVMLAQFVDLQERVEAVRVAIDEDASVEALHDAVLRVAGYASAMERGLRGEVVRREVGRLMGGYLPVEEG